MENINQNKFKNFTKYVQRKDLSRFLVHSEIFKKILNQKGVIVECGVHYGGGVMTWAQLSAIHEPYNYHRKIFGFDTFEGFPELSNIDEGVSPVAKIGGLKPMFDVEIELEKVIAKFDTDRPISQIRKIELIRGDATKTIPDFVEKNKWAMVSLLHLDFDIYEPTVVALRNFVPRMPKGSIIIFDELSNWDWPGETAAFDEVLGIGNYKVEQFQFEPNISFLQL